MEPDLDRDGVRKQAGSSQPVRDLTCVAQQDRGELLSRDKISFEGVLDRDRLRLSIRLDGPIVTRIRQIHQSLRMRLPDHLHQLVEAALLKISNRLDANAMEFLLCDWADPSNDTHLHRSQQVQLPTRFDDGPAVR